MMDFQSKGIGFGLDKGTRSSDAHMLHHHIHARCP